MSFLLHAAFCMHVTGFNSDPEAKLSNEREHVGFGLRRGVELDT
jgi:hypothetical protein